MKNVIVIMTLLLGVLIAGQPGSGNLTVTVTGFESDDSAAIIALYRENEDVLSKAFIETKSIILNGNLEVVIEDLKYGKYAIRVYQDLNENGKLDHSWLGLPDEPLGFSGNFRLSLFSGMPTFQKLQFDFSSNSPSCRIKM